MAEDAEKRHSQGKTDKPDLMLMDVVMPGMNGFQACRAITTDEATRHIPVILCTSKNQETDKIWGVEQGAKDYVTARGSERAAPQDCRPGQVNEDQS